MPWWAAIYGAVLAASVPAALWVDIRDKRPVWHIACEASSSACLVFFVVAYWFPSVRVGGAPSVAALFVLSLAWETYSAKIDLSEAEIDPDLSERYNRATSFVAAAFGLILLAPAYVHGWLMISGLRT